MLSRNMPVPIKAIATVPVAHTGKPRTDPRSVDLQDDHEDSTLMMRFFHVFQLS